MRLECGGGVLVASELLRVCLVAVQVVARGDVCNCCDFLHAAVVAWLVGLLVC